MQNGYYYKKVTRFVKKVRGAIEEQVVEETTTEPTAGSEKKSDLANEVEKRIAELEKFFATMDAAFRELNGGR
jgi:hypothetical protein